MDAEAIKKIAEAAAAEAVKQASLSSNHQIFVYAIILAAFIAIPTIVDILMAYSARKKTWTLLIERASKDTLDKEELSALIKATAVGPPGISGMSRALMALAVIIILGIAVFHLLANYKTGSTECLQIINNVLSMLGATLAAITGFYFGGRSAEEKKKEEPKELEKLLGTPPQKQPAPSQPAATPPTPSPTPPPGSETGKEGQASPAVEEKTD